MKLQKGFTLIELMVVVAIIGILAAVSIPAYSDYVIRGKLTEAATALSALRVTFEQYYQDNRTYVNAANPGGCPVDVTTYTMKNFTLSCVAAASPPADTFTIKATGTGGVSGFVFTIDQSNTKVTTAVPTGWTIPAASCWVTKRGGVC